MITIRQGESYRIFLNLKQDGNPLIPESIEDIKVCIGTQFQKTYKQNGVFFDYEKNQWYIFPTQQDTLGMKDGQFTISCHVKYPDTSVIITDIDSVRIKKSCCGEVF